ncbi:MAG TPA: hypothetical protein VKA21_07255, partial [Candidatus Binatia bacterium]|nr:hypothetical protein [Candidatus Binatia bacterium]
MLPSADRPRLLVPLEAGRATATALQQLGHGTRASRSDRLALGVRRDVPAGDLPALVLEAHLARLLDRDDLVAAVALGPPRPNRKPVLMLAAPSGAVAAYAKVAWNPLTTALVRTEVETLAAYTRHPPASFAVPRVLASGRWNGHDVATVSALPHPRWRPGRR